jgi:hypothetical protein
MEHLVHRFGSVLDDDPVGGARERRCVV